MANLTWSTTKIWLSRNADAVNPQKSVLMQCSGKITQCSIRLRPARWYSVALNKTPILNESSVKQDGQ